MTISNSENTPNIDLHSFLCSSITYEMSSSDKVHLFTLVSQTFISVERCSSSNSFLLDFPKAESLIYHGDASLNQTDPPWHGELVHSLMFMIRTCDQHLLAYWGNWDCETAHMRTPTSLNASDIRYGELKCSRCARNSIWQNITAVSLSHGSVWGQPVWTR